MRKTNLPTNDAPFLKPDASPSEDVLNGRFEQLIAAEPWLDSDNIDALTTRILNMNAGLAVRYRQLTCVADRINTAIAPFAACRPGCDHCCSLVTLIYRFEAVHLAKISGRQMVELPFRSRAQVMTRNQLKPRRQCVFVVDGRCSVYADRPMICRLHHALMNDAEACRRSVEGTPQPISMYDPDIVELPYHALVTHVHKQEPWGAITEFFPPREVHAQID